MARSSRAVLRITVAASAVVAIPYALLVVASSDPQLNLDDSFITLAYARTFAESGAFEYNAGEGPVDGFTSTLDVLVKALAIRVAPAAPYRASIVVNRVYHLALLAACVLVVSCVTRAAPRWRLAACAGAPLLFASAWDLAAGAATELETPLYTLLGVLCVYLLPAPRDRRLGRRAAWAACVVLLPLARPEGLALAVLALGAYLVTRESGPAASDWLVSGVSALLLAAFYGWRFSTFGHWAPNTYYAKTSASRWLELRDGFAFLATYARHSVVDAAKLGALLAAPLLLLRGGWPDPAARARFALALGFATASVAIVVVSGGDSYTGSRRLMALPAALLLLMGFQLLANREAGLRALGAAFLAFLFLAFLSTGVATAAASVRSWRAGAPVVFRFPVACVREVVERLVSLVPGGTVAQSDFQMLKFFAPDQRVLDLHGLNDRALAHVPVEDRVTFGKFSQDAGIRANAELYVYGNRIWTDEPMAQHSLRAVLSDAEQHWRFAGYGRGPEYPSREKLTPEQIEALVRSYLPASIPGCGSYFNFLIRKDVARRLTADGRGAGVSIGRS